MQFEVTSLLTLPCLKTTPDFSVAINFRYHVYTATENESHAHIKQISSNRDVVSRLLRPSISSFLNISSCNSVDETLRYLVP